MNEEMKYDDELRKRKKPKWVDPQVPMIPMFPPQMFPPQPNYNFPNVYPTYNQGMQAMSYYPPMANPYFPAPMMSGAQQYMP